MGKVRGGDDGDAAVRRWRQWRRPDAAAAAAA